MPAVSPCPQGHQWQPHDDPSSGAHQVFCAVCGLIQSAADGRETVADPSPPAGSTTPTSGGPAHSGETVSYVAAPEPSTRPSPAAAPPPARGNLPSLDGYEVLGVLGRGGMGVVYQARQVSLKRLVALKMVLAGPHAGPAELARFKTEAEAVARLQHPNIVQIHEVGEQDGAPYFSLEFVDGGSLARKLAGRPLPGRQAAELVETLARAVHHAHQRGVVHRDLKPANVLLTSDGTPKITDFGLAKRLEGDVGQTQSGAIMGTPGYMAPEQAGGKTHEIGPPVDVYALGAILYELLTGRPPFRGDTVLDTLQKVLTEEVVPPSRLQPKVHRDLETICLKALAKDPGGRYPSALALAEDLGRFNAGEAILGRREGVAGRLWRRVRRSPVTAASLLLVLLVLAGAGLVVSRVGKAGELAEVNRAFEAGLGEDDWTPAHLERMEALVADLRRLAPGEAEPARTRLHDRFARAIHDALYATPVLQPGDTQRLATALDLLEARDAARAAALREELHARQGGLQRILDLRPPFDTLAKDFEADRAQVDGQALTAGAPAGGRPFPLVLTHTPCQGNVQLEAVFDYPSWAGADRLGLVLNAGPGQKQGYAFFLALPPPKAADPEAKESKPPANLGEARERGDGYLALQIHRDGVCQRSQLVKVALAAVRLRATREGDRLTVQVNDQPPVSFQDSFPAAGASQGVFGIAWPPGVRVTSVQAWQQALAPAASAVERGDDFYARGALPEALTYYQEQANTSPDATVRQEARCKAALCLVGLQRLDDADQLLATVAAEAGDRWPALAACRLWLLRVRRQQFAQADTVFDTLATRYRRDQLELVVPEDVRESILGGYLETYAKMNLFRLFGNPDQVRPLEHLVALQDLLFEDRRLIDPTVKLLYGYRIVGRNDDALRLTEQLLRLDSDAATPVLFLAVEHHAWLQQERGRATDGLAEVNRRLVEPGAGYRKGLLPLLVERARLEVALHQAPRAEQDLDELFRLVHAGELEYHPYAAGCLLRGFLREQRGDRGGALEAWRQGLYKNWRAESLKGRPAAEQPAEFAEVACFAPHSPTPRRIPPSSAWPGPTSSA